MNTEELNQLIMSTLEDNKANDIKNIDVTSLTNVTDRMIICTATSTRHAAALAEKVVRTAKKNGVKPMSVEGEEQGEWILIDLLDIIVHIMLEETREFYSLEKLWSMTETARQQNENESETA